MNNFIENLKKLKLPSFSHLQVCFDLGTSTTRIGIQGKGIALKEPTCLGLNKKTHEFIFFGQEAKLIIGKVPEFIGIVKPMVSGIISDFDAQVALIRKFVQLATAPYNTNYSLMKPRLEVIAAYPSTATEIEQKAVEEVFYKIGVSKVSLVPKILPTAIGCGFNIFAHKPVFIVDMGGGLIEMGIVSGGGTVTYKASKNAGEQMNKLVYNYIYLKHGIILGETTCEELKINLLSFKDDDKTMVVRGKSLETGLPKSAKIKTTDIKEALLANLNQISDSIKEIIEVAPPEVVDEIYEQGIVLTGGLSQIQGIDTFFSQELKVKVHQADYPLNTTVNGLLRLGRSKEHLQMIQGGVSYR